MTSISERIGASTRVFGAALVAVPWAIFLICYLLNPQWQLTRNALSDFGSPALTQYAWVYNYGLGISGVIIWFMSLGIVATAENKVKVFGGAFWFVAGIFLALIGYFHAGTTPHSFVSSWFFIQAAFAITILGIGAYPERDIKGAVVPIVIAILMPLGGIIVYFPSVAITEIYEIILIDSWAVFSLFYKPKTKYKPSVEETNSTSIAGKGDALIVAALSTVFLIIFMYAVFVKMFTFT